MIKANLLIAIATYGILCSQAHAASPAQQLESTYVNDCMASGMRRGDPVAAVASFCTCSWNVFSQTLTVSEYVKLDAAVTSANGNPTALPFWNEIQEKLAECKNNEPAN